MRWSTSTSLTCSVVAGALAWSCALTVLATGFWPYEIDVALLHWEPTPQRPRPIGVFIVSFEFAAEEIPLQRLKYVIDVSENGTAELRREM
jgi:hypothetical protein